MIAFTGEYDGNPDVYVIPATGGVPKRLTYHPGTDSVVGWTPDGKSILFSTWANSFRHFAQQLYTVPLTGGFPTRLPLPIAGTRVLLARRLAPGLRPARTVAGRLEALSRRPDDADLDRHARRLEHHEGPARQLERQLPAVDGRHGLFPVGPQRPGQPVRLRHDRRTRCPRRSRATGFDFKSASAGPDAIVVEQFGAIKLYDLASRQAKTVSINVAGRRRRRPAALHESRAEALPELRHLPHRGCVRVFEAWGEIFTVPTDKGDIRNLTRSPAVADRDPSWSPDGKSLAYFTDQSGEYELRDSRPERPRRDSPYFARHTAVVLLLADVVARQQEDRVLGQAAEAVVPRPRLAHARPDRLGLLRRLRTQLVRPGLVAR